MGRAIVCVGVDMTKQLLRQLKKNENNEKKGPYGAWRRNFCTTYANRLKRIQHNTQAALVQMLEPAGLSATCEKGCVHCCFHYVTVPLAHGIVIADRLYTHKALMTRFIDNFAQWHARGGGISAEIDRMRLRLSEASEPAERIMALTRPLSARYFEMKIPCPFLDHNRCLIYEVRPTSCSGHYSVSPPDWCAPASDRKPVLHNLIPNDDDLIEIASLADPRLSLYELALPTMIYKILTEGSLSMIKEIVQ